MSQGKKWEGRRIGEVGGEGQGKLYKSWQLLFFTNCTSSSHINSSVLGLARGWKTNVLEICFVWCASYKMEKKEIKHLNFTMHSNPGQTPQDCHSWFLHMDIYSRLKDSEILLQIRGQLPTAFRTAFRSSRIHWRGRSQKVSSRSCSWIKEPPGTNRGCWDSAHKIA